MWKQREEYPKSKSAFADPEPFPPVPLWPPPAPIQPEVSTLPAESEQTHKEPEPMREEFVGIGKEIVITGELSGAQDVTIEGRVEGKIELPNHVLTIGVSGRIKAQVTAKAIIVLGQVTGNMLATEKVDIKDTGSVEGDIAAPRVSIADGSHFRGSIDMQKKDHATPKAEARKPEPSSVNGQFALP